MNRFIPPDLLRLRRDSLRAITGILEHETRFRLGFSAMAAALERAHRRLAATLEHPPAEGTAEAESPRSQLARLDRMVGLLHELLDQDGRAQTEAIVSLLHHFEAASAELTQTLVEKELIDRQRAVLERIIFSYERISQWMEFLKEILTDFYQIFPFDAFFVAFAEKHGLTLKVFHPAALESAMREQLLHRVSQHVLASLGQPPDAAFDIEEHFLTTQPAEAKPVESMMLITERVPERHTKLAGILGAAFGVHEKLSPQEEAVIRSLLAIVVIVVGSSRALGQSLAELEYYSLHDPLTNLYNRRHFLSMLQYEITRSERHQHEFSLLMVDLDDFKDVNDTFGHPVGDEALCQVASHLKTCVRPGDLICRIGGDEFVILLPETGKEEAKRLARTIRDRLREHPVHASQLEFHLTASIGIVTYPADGANQNDLMTRLDFAAYEAKKRGKDGVFHYSDIDRGEEVQRIAQHRRQEAEVVRAALRKGRIVPYFQPIIETGSGRVVAYEVLARLIADDGEIVSAARFIDAIEKYGMGRELDRRMIAAALDALRRLPPTANDSAPLLFLNLSVQEIQNRNVLTFASRLCYQWEIDPHRIVFELLERDAISDMEKIRRFLSTLRKKGFRFALDDFGSGYNSFHYLRELEFDFVKIDGAFIRGIEHSKTDEALVRNLARLCHDLGIQTVAEFVESQSLLEHLRALGVTHAQGYYIGLPRPDILLFADKTVGR